MPYSDRATEVLKKYRILNPDGSARTVNLQRTKPHRSVPLGSGPLMSPDVVDRLIAADTTPDQRWLDWIFFQAAGGQAAKDSTEDAMNQIRDRFISERTNGWTHPTRGYQPPMSRAEAQARWDKKEPEFREVLAVGDQDSVERLRAFGYFRNWPGNANIYANVVDAVQRYLKFYPKLLQMNEEMARSGGTQLPTDPDGIATWTAMVEIARKVERYFASRKARKDIRVETIYDDDVITAIAPLTYAAAVKYGYGQWPWASEKGFEEVLSGEAGAWRDAWKQPTAAGKVIVYLSFKVPVPAWVTRKNGNWEVKDFTDLALVLDKSQSHGDLDQWSVTDQESNTTLTVGGVKERIMAEPRRVDTEDDDEGPVRRGANVYKDEAEAQRVVDSLDRAVRAVARWLAKFDLKKIKSDALTLD